MDNANLASIKDAVRPLYTELVVLRTAMNALKQAYPAKAAAIDQILAFVRDSKDIENQVDLDLLHASEIQHILQLALEAQANHN